MIVDTSETRYVTYNILDNLKCISMITVLDLKTNNTTQLSKICPYMHKPCFLFYVWNSFIALLNLIVIAIITLRREIKVTSMLIVAQCLMRDTLSYHTYRCITMPKLL